MSLYLSNTTKLNNFEFNSNKLLLFLMNSNTNLLCHPLKPLMDLFNKLFFLIYPIKPYKTQRILNFILHQV